MTSSLLCIVMPHATFGLVISTPRSGFEHAVVIDAPPIARYTMGWTQARVIDYFASRGAWIVPTD